MAQSIERIAAAEPTGTVARTATVLAALGRAPAALRLGEVARVTRLSRTSTHRILASLVAVNFVARDPATRVYRLGAALAEIGRAAARQDVGALAAPGLARLAEISQDTVFVSIPEGHMSVCVGRSVGSFPIHTLTLDIGDRRPLGVGAGALALYAGLPDAARAEACRRNAEWMTEFGDYDAAALEALRVETLALGHALNRGRIVAGMNAVAVPVTLGDGSVAAALSVAAIEARMTPERIEGLLLPALRREAATLARRLDPGPQA